MTPPAFSKPQSPGSTLQALGDGDPSRPFPIAELARSVRFSDCAAAPELAGARAGPCHSRRSVGCGRAGGRCRAAGSTGKALRSSCLLRSLPAVIVSLLTAMAGGEPFGRSQRKLLTRASTAQKSVARPLHLSLRRAVRLRVETRDEEHGGRRHTHVRLPVVGVLVAWVRYPVRSTYTAVPICRRAVSSSWRRPLSF